MRYKKKTEMHGKIPERCSLIRRLRKKLSEAEQALALEKKALEKEKKRSRFLMEALDSLPNPIFMKDENARFVFFNRKYEEFFEMRREDFYGKSVMQLEYLPEEDRRRYQSEDLRLIQSGEIKTYTVDFCRSNGSVHPSLYWSCGFCVEQEQVYGLIGEIVDISRERDLESALKKKVEELEEANKVIYRIARIDEETGLFNRRGFSEEANKMLIEARSRDCEIYLLMGDLDHFKRVNDSFGHLEGDHMIRECSRILRESCGDKGLLTRFGGEEFIALVFCISQAEAADLAERIRVRMEKELILPDRSPLTISIGIARYAPGEALSKTIARADAALYQAKSLGRNRIQREPALLAEG